MVHALTNSLVGRSGYPNLGIENYLFTQEVGTLRLANDDWPLLYLKDRLIPDINGRSMIELGLLGFAGVWLFLPKTGRLVLIDGREFFLGAVFMLLATKAVVQLALLFGGMRLVQSSVLLGMQTFALIASVFVLLFPATQLRWPYLSLLGLLVVAVLFPTETPLFEGIVTRFVVPGAVMLGRMFFAGVIVARALREPVNLDLSLGSFFAGAAVGCGRVSFSTLFGFRYLLLLVVAFCLLSLLPRSPASREAMT